MSNTRNRAISVGSAFANLPKYPSFRRSHSTVTGLSPKTLRVVVLGVEGVGKTGRCINFKVSIQKLEISLRKQA